MEDALAKILDEARRGELIFPTNLAGAVRLQQALNDPDCHVEDAAEMVVAGCGHSPTWSRTCWQPCPIAVSRPAPDDRRLCAFGKWTAAQAKMRSYLSSRGMQ